MIGAPYGNHRNDTLDARRDPIRCRRGWGGASWSPGAIVTSGSPARIPTAFTGTPPRDCLRPCQPSGDCVPSRSGVASASRVPVAMGELPSMGCGQRTARRRFRRSIATGPQRPNRRHRDGCPSGPAARRRDASTPYRDDARADSPRSRPLGRAVSAGPRATAPSRRGHARPRKSTANTLIPREFPARLRLRTGTLEKTSCT